jgi:NhaA family Na+:H+ antiporter
MEGYALAKPDTPELSKLPIAQQSGLWLPFRRRIQRVLAPVERFLAIEAASGIVLMLAAVAAFVWANSPWRSAYFDLWHIPIGIRFGSVTFQRDLHF